MVTNHYKFEITTTKSQIIPKIEISNSKNPLNTHLSQFTFYSLIIITLIFDVLCDFAALRGNQAMRSHKAAIIEEFQSRNV